MAENSFASKARSSGQGSYRDILEQKKETPTPLQSAITAGFANKNKVSNVDPAKKAVSDLIYLVKGVDAGRNAWYYVLVERLKVQLFLKALNDEIIHLEKYGKILYSAYGDEPPANVTQAIKDEYGIN